MSFLPSESTLRYLERLRDFYDATPTEPRWAARGYRSLLAHYYNLLVPADASVLEIGCGSGELLARLKATRKTGIRQSSPRTFIIGVFCLRVLRSAQLENFWHPV